MGKVQVVMRDTDIIFREHPHGGYTATRIGPTSAKGGFGWVSHHIQNLKKEDIQALRGGGHIQDVIPHVSSEDREFLISGTTPQIWRELFEGEEEECD